MVNRRQNGVFGPTRKVWKSLKKKQKSRIMQRCYKEANFSRQHYKDGLQDKDKARKIPNIRLENPISVRGPRPRKCSISLSGRTKPTSSPFRLNNGVSDLTKNITKFRASGRPNNGSSRHKKIENSKSSSSRLDIGVVPLANNIEMPKFSSSENNHAIFATKNQEKSCSSNQKNNMISSTKNVGKYMPSLTTNGLSLGMLANPTYVGSKDDSSSTSRIINNSRPSTEVVSCCMPRNVVVKHNVLDARNDGFVVSKFSTNNGVSISKDETLFDKSKYTRVDPSSLEKAMGRQVRQKDHSNALEATNFSIELDGSQIIQNGQHIFGNNSSPFSKDLSSHRLIEESPKDRINLDSKNQNTSHEDDDITNDDALKRDKRVVSLVHVSAKKRRRFIDNYEEDDGDHWNISGVGGVTAGVTSSTTIVKGWCTEVKSFVSESTKLQHYSLLPINEPIWSGLFKIGSKEFFPMDAHLSPKSCKKVWEVSRSLQPLVKVTNLSRLAAFPKGSAALKLSHDNIALYFLPQNMSPNEDVDQLVKELIENDMVLRAVVKEAEMLVLPSILLPEQHKTFKSKHYLWAVFRPRQDHVPVVEEHGGAGCHPCDEEMEDVSLQHMAEEGSNVSGLNINCEIQAPEQVKRQHIQKEPSPSSPETNAPGHVEASACPASAPTMAAAMPANHVQSSSSSLEAPSGTVFAFVAVQTPRLKELIQELKRDGALVVAVQRVMIE